MMKVKTRRPRREERIIMMNKYDEGQDEKRMRRAS
jgi:hypothetical protein